MKLPHLVILFTLSSLSLSAALASKESTSLTSRMVNRAAKYLLTQTSPHVARQAQPRCEPEDTGDCIAHVSGNYYPTQEQRIEAARACVGNFNDLCVKFVSGSYYPDFAQRVSSAKACRGNFNSECAKFVAGNYYPSFEQRIQAAETCHLVNVNCVKAVAGTYYPSFDERLAAAKACGGE